MMILVVFKDGVPNNLGGIQATPATMSGPMETSPYMRGADEFGGLLDYGQGQVDPGLQEARAMQDQINAQQQQAQQAAIQEAIVQQQIIEQQKQAERIKNDEIERERAIRLQIERERQIESNRQAAIAEANTRATLLAAKKPQQPEQQPFNAIVAVAMAVAMVVATITAIRVTAVVVAVHPVHWDKVMLKAASASVYKG